MKSDMWGGRVELDKVGIGNGYDQDMKYII